MLSTQLVNFQNDVMYPMVESGVYLNQDNIDNTEFAANTLYVIEGEINPETPTEYVFYEGCILKFNYGGYFGPNVTLRFIKSDTSEVEVASFTVVSPLQKIFDGTRIIGFFQNAEIPVEWFGAVGDGITDDAPAINACIKYSGIQTVLLGANSYLVKSTIEFTEANWESETFINTQSWHWDKNTETQEDEWVPLWPINKSFVSKGIIIGDANIQGISSSKPAAPVFRFYQIANTIDINCIQVLRDDDYGIGIDIASHARNKFYVGQIIKKNDEQGMPISTHQTIPTTSSGYGVVFGGYNSNARYYFGQIAGFKYGFCPSDTLSQMGVCRCGLNTFYIQVFYDVPYPIYFKSTKTNTYFNGNVFYLTGFNIRLYGVNKAGSYASWIGDAITFDKTVGNSCVSNVFYSSYMENVGVRFIKLNTCAGFTFNCALYADDLFPYSGASTTVNETMLTRAYKKQTPFTTDNIVSVKNCCHIKFTNTGAHFPFPIELVSYANCVDVVFNYMTLYKTVTGRGTYDQSKDPVIFDKVIYTRKNGEIKYADTDQNDTIILVEPNYRHLHQIEYVNTLPDINDRDSSVWYAVPETNQGLFAKYKVYIYDTTTWVGDHENDPTGIVTPDLYFTKKFAVIDDEYTGLEVYYTNN